MAEQLDTVQDTGTSNRNLNPNTGLCRGQSFRLGTAGSITAVDVYINNVGTARNCTLRCGTSSDLSSSYQESAAVNVAATGYKKFTLATPLAGCTTGVTYYFGLFMDAGTTGDIGVAYNSANPYADGQELMAYTVATWNLDDPADTPACDWRFRIYVDPGGGGGPETTGAKFPTAASSVSESPWSDDAWVNPTNIYSDNATNASVTGATYDAGDQTYVLKAQGFDFSAIPDNSTINGVICRVNAYYATAAVSIDLLQLLNTSGAKVGTNQCSTPEALGTDSAGIVTKGSSSDNWGNDLTAAWVKNSNFGVAIGCLAGGSGNSNNDVYIDYVTLEIYYTPPEAGGDAMPMAMNQFRHLRS